MTEKLLLLGPPGTGKTTRLLSEMKQHMEQGVPPNRIAFVSFTRAAVREARELAKQRFNLVDDDLPYVRTIHSLAFHQLGLKRSDVFGFEALSYLSEITGEQLTGKTEMDVPTLGERGDALLFLDQYARASMKPLENAWQEHDTPIDWFRLIRFVKAYKALREDLGLIDFTDMLEEFVSVGQSVNVDVVLIDEAQDLTPLQWRVVDVAFNRAKRLIVSGDDDQGIYKWAGASVDALLTYDAPREVLGQSHRLPRAIWQLAAEVAGGISQRHAKPFAPSDRAGAVEWLGRPEEVDLSTGTWLLLGRTRRQLVELAEIARSQGVVYYYGGKSSVNPAHVDMIMEYERFRSSGDPSLPIWHDALTDIPLDDREYLLSCRRNGESLTKPPRVRIDTIHGAKGLEADYVMLLTDLSSAVKRGQDMDPDSEQRVLYVAVTRARETLFLVAPQGRGAYYQI